jgi:hypothetical protein
MMNVEPDIRMIVVASTFCLPIRSPSGPKNNPPKGRTTNATASTANEDSTALVAVCVGKNRRPTVAVIAPALYTPKSNHSMQFPIAEAATALRTVRRPGSGTADVLCSSMWLCAAIFRRKSFVSVRQQSMKDRPLTAGQRDVNC